MTLSEALVQKENNVSAIKAVAAWLVIIGHAFAFSCNYEQVDFLGKWTDGAYNFGGFAVAVFFFFSGLFITRSLLSGKYNWKGFFKRRITRIFPPFLLVTVLIIGICGFFFTDYSVGAYFLDVDTYRYLLNCVFVTVHNLPGVFAENVYGSSVNGPVWTIKVEVICYILCFTAYQLRMLEKRWAAYWLGPAILLAVTAPHISGIPAQLLVVARPVGMYAMGMACGIYADKVVIGRKWAWAGIAVYCLCVACDLPELGIFLAMPEVLCGIAFCCNGNNICAKALNSVGKRSYETYLWGGFTGQAVVSLWGGYMSPYVNMAITIPVATCAAYLTNIILNWKRSRKV